MLICLGVVLGLAARHRELRRTDARLLLALYPAFLLVAVLG